MVPPKTVLCTPSKALETWVLVALFPQNLVAADDEIECRNNPEAQLAAQPLNQRLIRSEQKQIKKYRERAGDIKQAWTHVMQRCSEADRFSQEFLTVIPTGAQSPPRP